MIAIVKILPYLVSFLLGIGAMIGIQRATRQDIKLECPAIDYSQFPKCPECPATLGNEFEKVKGKNITLNLTQNMNVQMNGDSLVVKKIIDEMNKELQKIRLARCK